MKDRIKEVRTAKKLSQTAFGKQIGLTPSAISKIESGEREPAGSTIRLICTTYHVNYLWLTEGRGPMFEEQDIDSLIDQYTPGESELFKSVVRGFYYLPDEEWDRLKNIIDKVKKEGR